MQDLETIGTVKKCRTQIVKTLDALRRASDGLGVEPLGTGSLAYTLQQFALVLAYVSEAREALENLQARRGEAAVEELARRRLADKTYTPSVNEVLYNPDGYMEGFREG